MAISTFAVKQDGPLITVINHLLDGTQQEITYAASDVLDLVAALMAAKDAHDDQQMEDYFDMMDEQQAYLRSVQAMDNMYDDRFERLENGEL